MLQFIFAILFLSSAYSQNVADTWPKGLVATDVAHVKVLFDKDVVPFESIGSEVKGGFIKLEKGKLKDCRWDNRRLAHCKIAEPLTSNSSDAIVVEKFRREFRTLGLHLVDYRESIVNEKFRIKLKFSQQVARTKVKIAVGCGNNPVKAFVGELSTDGTYSLPIKANANELCHFSFPEGVQDTKGRKHSLPGEWLLRGRLGLPNEETRYQVAIRSIGCGRVNHWSIIESWRNGETMPVIECSFGAKLSLNLSENWQNNIKLNISYGGPELKTERWGGSSGDIPMETTGSFTITATHLKDPQLSVGYIVLLRPAENLLAGYAELGDDGSYFEHKPPYLIKLNHRAIPLVEVSAKKLTDDGEIIRAVKKGDSYWDRRIVDFNMPEGKMFQLEAQGSEEYNSGIDLNRLNDFSSGIWWVQSKVAAPSLASPLSLPEGDEKTLSSAAVLQFSDLGIHIKRGLRGGLVWVFQLSTGKPVADAQVIISHNDSILELGLTKKDGTIRIPHNKQIDANGVVIAKKDNDMVALPLNYQMQSGISNWDYGQSMVSEEDLTWFYDAIPSNPMYRPGEKVELKLFARKTGLLGPEIDQLNDVAWNITDPRGEKVASGLISFNKFGTAFISAALEKEAVTGKYNLSIGKQTLEPFSVEIYRAPTLKVTIDPLKMSQPLNVAGDVEFHVGGGVQDTDGEVALILKTKSFAPPLGSIYEAFSFTQENDGSINLIGKESFTTNKLGRFNSKFSSIDLPEYGSLIAEATVTDGDGSTVSNRTDITVSKRGWFLGTKLEGYVFNDGSEVRPQLIVLNNEGQEKKGVKIKLALERRTWNTVRRLGSGNTYYYDSEERRENLGTCEVISSEKIVNCPLKIKGEGSYTITSIASFNGQAANGPSLQFWVPGANSWGWGARNNHDRIDIIPEKASYEFGESAKFLIQSPYKEGEALVTVERYGVIRHEVIRFKGGIWTYQLPLEDSAYVPGIYVSVVMLKGRTNEKYEGGVDLGRPSFKMGYAQIQVKRTPMILKVNAKTEPRYSPGDEVKVELDVTDWKGSKVDGELAVTVVDDAVLQLVPNYKSFFEVMDTFYHIKGIGVWNYQTLTRLIGRRSYGKKGAVAGGGGGQGSDVLRSNFKTVAHWEPRLEIENGKAKFKFKLPDNLTSWRVIAVAVDDKHRFGEGETVFKSLRPLMLTPFFPPFLRLGDQFVGSFGIQNATENKLEASLSAKLENLTPQDITATKVVLPGVRELVNFPFKANLVSEIDLVARVAADKFKDGIRIQFPVLANTNNTIVNGYLTPLTGAQTLSYSIPKEALTGTAKLKVVFSKSLLDGLDDAFKYVVGYPYGCWEQKTTGALFLTQYKQMQPWLAEFKFDESKGDARQAIQNYIDSASNYQRPDGSMGYYPGDYAGDPYLTIFTGHAFTIYKKAGFKISEKVNSLLMDRLKAMKDHSQEMGRFTKFTSSMKAYIAAILVELGDKDGAKVAAKMYSERSTMDLFGKGMLLKALPKGSKEAQTLMDELLKGTITTGSSVNFQEKVSDEAKNWLHTLKRSECVVTEALLRHGVNNALAAKLIFGLAPGRNSTRWYNTQENFFCFQAYQTYAELFESTDKEAVISWNYAGKDENIEVKRLKNTHAEYDEKVLKTPGSAKAKLVSGGNAYIRSVLRYEVNSVDVKAASNGFALNKTVLLKTAAGWRPLTGPVWKMKKGDTVKIVLKVRALDNRYKVGLNDPLPAAWRALNPRLATTSMATQVEAGVSEDEEKSEYDWWDWYTPNGFVSTDMRDSSVQYFADTLLTGENYELEYLAQVTTVGDFTLPATVIEEMYNEENRANTTGVKINVVE